jgi:hypothetical protein
LPALKLFSIKHLHPGMPDCDCAEASRNVSVSARFCVCAFVTHKDSGQIFCGVGFCLCHFTEGVVKTGVKTWCFDGQFVVNAW